jgi:hypothetical protein
MKRRIASIILALILTATVLPTVYAAYITTEEKKIEGPMITDTSVQQIVENNNDKSIPIPQAPQAIAGGEAEVVKKQTKKVVDISKIKLDKGMESIINKTHPKDADRHIDHYKTLLAEFDVPDQYRTAIEKQLKKGRSVPEVLGAYAYLNENYGEIEELEGILEKKSKGKAFKQLFSENRKANKEFIPTNFEMGYIEELMKDQNITADDIMIADMISQKGIKKFEDLIEMRKQGKTWKEINTRLGIVNTSDKLPRIAITASQVKKYMEKTGLREEEVVEALVLAGKLDKDNEEIVNKVKAGKKKDEILAEGYEEKYK